MHMIRIERPAITVSDLHATMVRLMEAKRRRDAEYASQVIAVAVEMNREAS
jgi:hypothetical protein